MKIKVDASISRNSNDEICFTFVDDASHVKFLDVRMTPGQFAMMVTGLSGIEVSAEVRGLDVVGKTKIQENRSIEYPSSIQDRAKMVAWLEQNGKEDGWLVNSYLGSQGSVGYADGKTILHYSVYRFAEVDDGR